MVRLRRILLVGMIWLTAVTSLIAGFPHFNCVCPNGNRKPFCLGFGCGPNGCCCAGGCCSSGQCGDDAQDHATSAQSAKPCCCCCSHKEPPTSNSSHRSPEARSPGCHKTLVQAQFVVEPFSPLTASIDQATSMTVQVDGIWQTASLGSPAAFRLIWEPHRLPPPTDLVVALRHFVI